MRSSWIWRRWLSQVKKHSLVLETSDEELSDLAEKDEVALRARKSLSKSKRMASRVQ
jgi:hypothetical protein